MTSPSRPAAGGSYVRVSRDDEPVLDERTEEAAAPSLREKRPGDRIRITAYDDGSHEMEVTPAADHSDDEIPAPAPAAKAKKGR